MRSILAVAFLVALLLIASAISLEIAAALDPNFDHRLSESRTLIRGLGLYGWDFFRPLLQLMIVFVIIEWVIRRLGISVSLKHLGTGSGSGGTWTVQTFIAGMVVITFCVAALADIKSVVYIKDVVLIVIGFYFGTRAKNDGWRSVEVVTEPPPLPQDSPASRGVGRNDKAKEGLYETDTKSVG